MAKYEKTRTYVVGEILKRSVVFKAPKGRAYHDIELYTDDLPNKTIKALKVGKRVTFVRMSGRNYTQFVPKA